MVILAANSGEGATLRLNQTAWRVSKLVNPVTHTNKPPF
jgi:hypothetical protein